MPSARWTRVRDVHSLGFGFAYAAAVANEDGGRLADLDYPVSIGSAGSTLIMLSVSRGTLAPNPTSLAPTIVERLLAEVQHPGSSAGSTTARIQARLWELFGSGAFQGAVPKGVVLTILDRDSASVVRFGPVAVAMVCDGAVEPLHSDDRFPALQRQGVRLEQVAPALAAADQQVLAVSSLIQLDPATAAGAIHARLPQAGTIVLLSRAVVPFVLPRAGASLHTWASAESGWQHGMSGAVIQVFRREEGLRGDLFPWLNL
jgi:hypothetical protein